MDDATKGKFDAVIVTDASRWSRSNAQSSEYIEILKRNGIRFFVGSKEIDFNSYLDCFVLTMNVAIAEMNASEHAFKSITNRIERAKKDYPSGRSPWGRKFNKRTEKWETIPGAKEKIQEIAKQYLEGNVIFPVLAKKIWNESSISA